MKNFTERSPHTYTPFLISDFPNTLKYRARVIEIDILRYEPFDRLGFPFFLAAV